MCLPLARSQLLRQNLFSSRSHKMPSERPGGSHLPQTAPKSAPNCQSFHGCPPSAASRARPRGCAPRPVAQRGSAAWRVRHHPLRVSMCGVTKPCASDPGGKPKPWSKNVIAFGVSTFSFPAFGGIWGFWLGKLTFPSQTAFGEGHLQTQSQSVALPKDQPRHEVASSL